MLNHLELDLAKVFRALMGAGSNGNVQRRQKEKWLEHGMRG